MPTRSAMSGVTTPAAVTVSTARISRAAALITELEKRNFYASVPPAIKDRFAKLLQSEPDLKAQYDKVKAKA